MAAATKQRKRQLPALRHLDGCPEDPERLETYAAQRPHNGERLMVTRCQDCGAELVEPRNDEGDDD